MGLSKLIYNASALPVPKYFCDQVKKTTFNFIWDNKIAKSKKEKNNCWRTQKRGSEYDRFYLNEQSPKVHLDKTISIHPNENSAWTVIPNEVTLHLGGLTFLSTRNCNSKDLNIKELPFFYEKMLQYWFEFKDVQNDKTPYTKKTIIWNNQDIKIDNKMIFSVLGLIKEFIP